MRILTFQISSLLTQVYYVMFSSDHKLQTQSWVPGEGCLNTLPRTTSITRNNSSVRELHSQNLILPERPEQMGPGAFYNPYVSVQFFKAIITNILESGGCLPVTNI